MRLLFVYNADGTLIGQLGDAVHKALSPSTYQCHLCRLTYGLVREKKQWRTFVDTLPLPTEFLHRDELGKRHPQCAGEVLPALFVVDDEEAQVLIPAVELNGATDLADLCRLVTERVGALPV